MRIGIIGAGISGLGAASLLCPYHDVVVLEASDRIGGHSRTVDVSGHDGTIPIDTGFIVYNEKNYPLFTRLLAHLGIQTISSNMSFGVTVGNGWLEYGTDRLADIWAQKTNIFRWKFWQMLVDILRFNRQARMYLTANSSVTLGNCLDELQLGEWVRDNYLLAMGGAIWSTPLADILAFPAASFIRFFDNHGLLSVSDHPKWRTIWGGSRRYVDRLIAPFRDRIYTHWPVQSVRRSDVGWCIGDGNSGVIEVDAVVFACHAPTVVSVLDPRCTRQIGILSAFKTQANRAVLHRDSAVMPQRKRAWSSWVYSRGTRQAFPTSVSLSYWMNRLQSLPTSTDWFVTLNPNCIIIDEKIVDVTTFFHPIFDQAAVDMQSEISGIQGVDNLWFSGAYTGYGFHEDGLRSGVRVAQGLGVSLPW